MHDITVQRKSRPLEQLNDSVRTIADKGYNGKDYVVLPRKKPDGRELRDEHRRPNRNPNSAREAIENMNQRLKIDATLYGVHWRAIDDFEKITKII